jgi:hypothetical protein
LQAGEGNAVPDVNIHVMVVVYFYLRNRIVPPPLITFGKPFHAVLPDGGTEVGRRLMIACRQARRARHGGSGRSVSRVAEQSHADNPAPDEMALLDAARLPILPVMFVVNEAEAAAIRAAYEQGGELSAVVELRRLFPGLANNENTRACALSIAGWEPKPPPPEKPRRARSRRSAPLA